MSFDCRLVGPKESRWSGSDDAAEIEVVKEKRNRESVR